MTTQEACGSVESKHVGFKGLNDQEIQDSRTKYGSNVLTPPEREPWWRQFLGKFDDPVIRILMIAAVLAIAVGIFSGKYYEGVGIIAAIFLATTIAFWNEFKAGKEFDVLNRTNDQKPIKAFRNGHWTEVERKDIVVGDIVQLEQGYEVPADGAVLEAMALHVSEAVLTGENVPVTKTVCSDNTCWDPKDQKEIPSDVVCRGTWITEGSAIVRIQKVGDETLWGTIAKSISEDVHIETPLDQQLDKLSKWIGVVGFSIAALIFFALVGRDVITGRIILLTQQWVFAVILTLSVTVALVRIWLPVVYDFFELTGKEISAPDWLEDGSAASWGKTIGAGLAIFIASIVLSYSLHWIPSAPSEWLPLNFGLAILGYFMIAVTIIVVAVPEGLAMSVTLSLAYSMRRMMKTGTLIRKMSACETIGATTVICSDKTGTLTKNQMQTHDVVAACGAACKCGDNGKDECQHATRCSALMFEAISVNTMAQLEKEPGAPPKPLGNPTEGALLLWLDAQGGDYLELRDKFTKEGVLPFDSNRKYMATIGISPDDCIRRLHVKGAPEIVLGCCSKVMTEAGFVELDPDLKSNIITSIESYQKRGFRVLGFAFKDVDTPCTPDELEKSATDLTWLSFVAIEDPVRDEVPKAVQVCHGAGIEVKMVTGDHPETAEEVARQLGLLNGPAQQGEHVTGKEFGKLNDEQAEKVVKSIRILSRALPEHKERMVKLLRKANHVVAVTGDGVNDAPAMKHANVALAMGSGTDVAKECSQVILLNDSFATIKSAVMWGRTLYQNIQRFIVFQLTVNVAALGVALLGPFIGVDIPLTVIQLLWINLIMDTFAALALATEPPNENVMNLPPRDPDAFIVTKKMFKWIFGFGIAFLLILIAALLYIKDEGVNAHELSLFFAMFVMLQFWNLFNARCFGLNESALNGFWKNAGFIVITSVIFMGTVLMIQFGGEVFRVEPLSLREWIYTIAGTSMVLWIGEIVRIVGRSRSQVAE